VDLDRYAEMLAAGVPNAEGSAAMKSDGLATPSEREAVWRALKARGDAATVELDIRPHERTHHGWIGAIVCGAEERWDQLRADQYILESALGRSGGTWNCPELINLAGKLGGRAADIAQTMVRSTRNRYARITDRQIRAGSGALLSRYGTARAAIAAALGITEDALLAAGEEERRDG